MKSETTYQAVLGRLIVQKRQEKQIDQGEMARHVGVSRSTWSRIEAGASALTMDQLAKAATVAFLGGAVLGGIVAGIMSTIDSDET